MKERVFYPELESEEAFREFMNETPSMKAPKLSYKEWWKDFTEEEGEEYPLNDEAFFINRTMDPLAAIFEDETESAAFREADDALMAARENGEDLKEPSRAFRAGIFGMLQHLNPFWSVGKDLLSMWNASQKESPSVFRLGRADYGLFADLATVDEEALLGKKGIVAFGAVLTNEETGKDQAASLLIFADKEADDICPVRRVELLWLFTAPSLRGRHAADELMAAMYWYCVENGIFLVRADVPSRDFRPLYFLPYLMKWQIHLAMEEEAEIFLRLPDIDGSGCMDILKEDKRVRSLEEFSQRQIRDFYRKNSVGSEEDADELDRELSGVIAENGEIQKLLPVKKHPSKALEIGYALPAEEVSRTEISALYYHTLDLAMDTLPVGTMVLIRSSSEDEMAVLDQAFPNHEIPVHYRGFNGMDPEDEDFDLDMEAYEMLRSFYYLCREGNLQEIMANLDIPRDTEAINPYAAVLALIAENPDMFEEANA